MNIEITLDANFIYASGFLDDIELLNCTDYVSDNIWKTTKWLDDCEFSIGLFGKITHGDTSAECITKSGIRNMLPPKYRVVHALSRMRLLYIPQQTRVGPALVEPPEEPQAADKFILAFIFITNAQISVNGITSYIYPGDIFIFPADEKIVIVNEYNTDIKAFGVCLIASSSVRLG